MDYYFKIAGKKTRPINTFNNIYKWIKNRFGVLLIANYNNVYVDIHFLLCIKILPIILWRVKIKIILNCNISHFLQWEAMKYLKNYGIRYYEVGNQDFTDTLSKFTN